MGLGRTGMASRSLRDHDAMPGKSSRASPRTKLGPEGPRPHQLAHRTQDTTQPGQLRILVTAQVGGWFHANIAWFGMIHIAAIEEAAYRLMQRAAIDIPEDYRAGVLALLEREENELSRFVLSAMVENWQAASEDRRAMCADTGLPRYYVKLGNEARIEGGFIAMERALRRATARATRDIPLRPNRVHPITRHDHNNNVRHPCSRDRL